MGLSSLDRNGGALHNTLFTFPRYAGVTWHAALLAFVCDLYDELFNSATAQPRPFSLVADPGAGPGGAGSSFNFFVRLLMLLSVPGN